MRNRGTRGQFADNSLDAGHNVGTILGRLQHVDQIHWSRATILDMSLGGSLICCYFHWAGQQFGRIAPAAATLESRKVLPTYPLQRGSTSGRFCCEFLQGWIQQLFPWDPPSHPPLRYPSNSNLSTHPLARAAMLTHILGDDHICSAFPSENHISL